MEVNLMKKFFLFLNVAFVTLSFSVNGAKFTNDTDRICQIRSVYDGRGHLRIKLSPGETIDIETVLYEQLSISCDNFGTTIEFKPSDNYKIYKIKLENRQIKIE